MFRKKKRYVWEMRWADFGGNQIVLALAEGWEPFAVLAGTSPEAPTRIWMRRRKLAPNP